MQPLMPSTSELDDRPRFSLAALLEFPAVCGVLLALSPSLNPACDCCLMVMAVALAARQGLLALLMLMAASLTADLPAHSPQGGFTFAGQALVFLLAGLLCVWYQVRRKFIQPIA